MASALFSGSTRLAGSLHLVSSSRGNQRRQGLLAQRQAPGRWRCALANEKGPHGFPQFPLTEEEKEERKKELLEEYKHAGDVNQQQLKQKLLQKELKLGSWLIGQKEYAKALPHYEKVLASADLKSAEYGDAGLLKAKCLEKLDRQEDAKTVYASLLNHHYPRVRQQADQALNGSQGGEAGGQASYYWYFRRYMNSGSDWGSYVATGSDKRIESEEEKVAMRVLPWTLVLMGPVMIAYFLLNRGN